MTLKVVWYVAICKMSRVYIILKVELLKSGLLKAFPPVHCSVAVLEQEETLLTIQILTIQLLIDTIHFTNGHIQHYF